jgi:HSP20 family protein
MYNTISLFDRMFNDPLSQLNDLTISNYGTPKITSTGDTYEVELALPGFSKKDVNVEVEGRKLVISAEVSEDNETAYRRSFKKVYFLPSDVDTDVISAKMENGVLQILFGKAETAKKIKIG